MAKKQTTRPPLHVLSDISELLMRSSKDEGIDTGDAITLLGDAYDVISVSVKLKKAVAALEKTFNGDSNDAEHDAAVALVEAFRAYIKEAR